MNSELNIGDKVIYTECGKEYKTNIANYEKAMFDGFFYTCKNGYCFFSSELDKKVFKI